MAAPYTKVNVKDINVFVKIYELTGSEWWPVNCTVTRSLSFAKNEVDVTSSCGQDFLQGNDDNSAEFTAFWLDPASYAGEDVVTASELFDLYQSGATPEFAMCDGTPSTASKYGFSFSSQIFGFADDIPLEGGVTTTITLRPRGTITKLIS